VNYFAGVGDFVRLGFVADVCVFSRSCLLIDHFLIIVLDLDVVCNTKLNKVVQFKKKKKKNFSSSA